MSKFNMDFWPAKSQNKTGVTYAGPGTTFFGNPIKWSVWAFFGNDDDGYIGDTDFNPEQKDTAWIRIKWWTRNIAHNFTHYIIGLHHIDTIRYDEFITEQPGWNRSYSMIDKPGSTKKYPFWLRVGKKWTFYIGYRGNGSFGIAFRK